MSVSGTTHPTPSSIRFWEKDGVRVLSVSGPLTLTTLFGFQDAWRGEASSALVFDLSDVPYADSAAIGSVVNAYVSRQNSGRKMVVAACDRVQKVMQVTKVATLFPVFSTLDEAVQSLKGMGTIRGSV
jgi:anti-sigma B factor antagonist